MDRIRYISVPLNEDGIKDYNYGEESNNIKVFKLKENEYSDIYKSGVFDEINIYCNLLIDDYEAEEIDNANLEIALNIAIRKKSRVLVKALELAIERNTFVGLDF